jgi:hypothetical protein
LVDVFFGNIATAIGFFEPLYAFFPVVTVLLCPVGGIAYDKPGLAFLCFVKFSVLCTACPGNGRCGVVEYLVKV